MYTAHNTDLNRVDILKSLVVRKRKCVMMKLYRGKQKQEKGGILNEKAVAILTLGKFP